MPIWAVDLDGLEEKLSNTAVSLKPGLTIINTKQASQVTKGQNSPSTMSHLKSLADVNTTSIKQNKKFSDAEMLFYGIGSKGKVGLDQNPILALEKTSYKMKETIEDIGSFGKYLKTETEFVSVFVDIHKGLLSGKISEIKVTTSTNTTYSKIDYVNANGDFGISLNSKNSIINANANSSTIPLDKSYERNLGQLPKDLRASVESAVLENKGIAERAMKGVYEAPKGLEKDADDAKLIPNKGKYYQGQNVPTTNGQNN